MRRSGSLRRRRHRNGVYIAGGGMAGLEAPGCFMSEGTSWFYLLEAGDRLGGQFITAGQAPGKRR